jgi:hypothetical protein
MARLWYFEAKIASGTALSAEIDLRSHRIVGIQMPATWTAAALTFQAAAYSDGVKNLTETFVELVDDNNAAVTVATPAQATFIAFRTALRDVCASATRLKIRSGTSGVPVNQAADRVLVVVCEPRDSMS